MIHINTSVVVLAKGIHNPTILQPYFLSTQKIVPFSENDVHEYICTPGFSLVKYDNGITFKVEGGKFQVLDECANLNFNSSKVSCFAAQYIQILPHVPYSAVGINFRSFLNINDPDMKLLKKFLKKGPWNSIKLNAKTVGLRFIYSVTNGILRLSIDSGSAQQNSQNLEGIVFDANYHFQIKNSNNTEDVIKIINTYKRRFNHFSNTIKTIMEKERQ